MRSHQTRQRNAQIDRAIRRVVDDAAIMYPRRVESRNADGTLNLKRMDSECVERSGVCALPTGQVVNGPCGPTPNLQGAAGLGKQTSVTLYRKPWVAAIDPDYFIPGSSYTVDVTGRGFTESFALDWLIDPESDEIHPGITNAELRYVDDRNVEIDIEVALDAAPIAATTGTIAYDNVGSVI